MKQWEVFDPQDKKYIVNGLYRFCKKHRLGVGHMYSVASGKRKHHKGWRCMKII